MKFVSSPGRCAHIWNPEKGENGETVYKLQLQLSKEPIVTARCIRCNVIRSFARSQWRQKRVKPILKCRVEQ